MAQRGEFRLPTPVPPEYAGFAGSLKMNVLTLADRRVWQNCLYTLDRNGMVKERWTQWDRLCEGSDGPGPHRLRISPYDPARRVWVINETFHQIYVFSNDGKQLLKTLGEKGVPGADAAHFAKPQDVAFLPDGRVLIADGLDNHRVMIFDRDLNYLAEFGGKGTGPGQFSGVHAVAVGPEGRIFALDRSGGRVDVFRTTADPKKVEFVAAWPGFSLPLDLIVNDDAVWMTDLKPLRFVKLDFTGQRLYTWMVPPELPDGYLEVHTFSVDGAGNLYGGDNQVRPDAEVRAQAGGGSEAAHSGAVEGAMTRRAAVVLALSALAAAGTSATQGQQAALAAAEQSVAAELARSGAPGAAVAVVAGDTVVWSKGFGVANVETGAPVSPDTLFQIGSATKMFTAAALLSAGARGAVALDRPVSTYVSGLTACVGAPTLTQLLSHTGGLMDEPDEFGPQGEEGLAAYARTWSSESCLLPPGRAFFVLQLRLRAGRSRAPGSGQEAVRRGDAGAGPRSARHAAHHLPADRGDDLAAGGRPSPRQGRKVHGGEAAGERRTTVAGRHALLERERDGATAGRAGQ